MRENEGNNQEVSVAKASPGQKQSEQDESPKLASRGSEQLEGETVEEDYDEYSDKISENTQRRLYVITIIQHLRKK
jgi:hypothetical protein